MKSVIHYINQHKHLFIVSLASGLLVVLLQFVISSLTNPTTTDDFSSLQIERATGVIVPQTKQTPNMATMSLLSSTELESFNSFGIVEDKNIQKLYGQSEVLVEKLFISFDIKSGDNLEEKILSRQASIRVPNVSNSLISVCGKDNPNLSSCTQYLTSRAGNSMPLQIAHLSNINSTESVIKLDANYHKDTFAGLYTGKPISLNIKAI